MKQLELGTCGALELEKFFQIKNRINERVFNIKDLNTNQYFIAKVSRFNNRYKKNLLIDQEAKILNSIKGVCCLDQIVNFGLLNGEKAIILKKLEGECSNRISFDLINLCKVIRKLSVAIKKLHDMQIVHNDITPDNILIEARTFNPMLIDFELAFKLNSTVCYSFGGTPCYMSPERINGGPLTHHSDQYSFSLVCLEWILGRSFWATPDLSCLKQPLRGVFAKGLSLLSKDRYKSILQFGEDLVRILLMSIE